ncbi:MAG: hypothetical protein HY815_33720 [Candidatus Riflebacteria bacterium]|nr:hypothetical protein [Candidatus Riflebacteria bacterium]
MGTADGTFRLSEASLLSRRVISMRSLWVVLLGGLLTLGPVVAADGLAKIISFTTRESEIRDIVQAIARLADQNVVIDPKIRGKMALTVKEVTAEDALHLVAGITGNKIAVVRGVLVFAPEETIKYMLGPGRTSLNRLRYAKAEDVAAILNKVYPKDASAVHHATTNTVIVTPK